MKTISFWSEDAIQKRKASLEVEMKTLENSLSMFFRNCDIGESFEAEAVKVFADVLWRNGKEALIEFVDRRNKR